MIILKLYYIIQVWRDPTESETSLSLRTVRKVRVTFKFVIFHLCLITLFNVV